MALPSVRILDGGLGTTLEDDHGIRFSSAVTPLWSSHLLLSPDGLKTLETVQRDFRQSGADVLLTATYQISQTGFYRTPDRSCPRIQDALESAVDIAENALSSVPQDPSSGIALSLGPYGATLIPGQEYSGRYDSAHDDEESLFQWHLGRLRLFASIPGLIQRLSYVAFETLPRLDELRAVRRAISIAGFPTPFWISAVFPGEGELAAALPDGSPVGQVVRTALEGDGDLRQPFAVGINCTKVHKLPALVKEFGDAVFGMLETGQIATPPSLVLYPDGTKGEVYNTTTQQWESATAKEQLPHDPWEVQLSSVVRDAFASGSFTTFLVGGCCKASPRDIYRLRQSFNLPIERK